MNNNHQFVLAGMSMNRDKLVKPEKDDQPRISQVVSNNDTVSETERAAWVRFAQARPSSKRVA